MDHERPTWDPFLGPVPDMTALPMDFEAGDEQFRFDDGTVWATVSIRDGSATIHEFHAHDASLAGARTGIGRIALALLRPHFVHVMAGGVGEVLRTSDPDSTPLHEQSSFLFWRGMLREGLIDEIDVMGCGTRFTRENFGGPVTVAYGQVVEPDPGDAAVRSPGP